MANEDGVLELYFPLGINSGVAYAHQPPLTTPIIKNVRIRDVLENRARGGQRAGLLKAFAEQAGTDRPVIKLVNVINTYVPAE